MSDFAVPDQTNKMKRATKDKAKPNFKKRKRKPWSEADREKMRQKMKERYANDPGLKDRISAANRAYWTPERRQAHADRMREVLSRPEVKERIREGQKAFWKEFLEIRSEMAREEV